MTGPISDNEPTERIALSRDVRHEQSALARIETLANDQIEPARVGLEVALVEGVR